MVSERERGTARHEAAHAVATFFRPEGGKTVRASIDEKETEPDEEGFHLRGRSLEPISPIGGWVDWEALRAMVVAHLAGIEADLHGVPEAARGAASTGGESDYGKAHKLISDALQSEIDAEARAKVAEGVALDAREDVARQLVDAQSARIHSLLFELWGEARELVDTKWEHIEAVADALLEHKTLSGDEVHELIEGVETRLTA